MEQELEGYSEYWKNKILKNIQHDEEITKKLYAEGWSVLRFWESDIRKKTDECVRTIEQAIFDMKLENINLDL